MLEPNTFLDDEKTVKAPKKVKDIGFKAIPKKKESRQKTLFG